MNTITDIRNMSFPYYYIIACSECYTSHINSTKEQKKKTKTQQFCK